MSKMPEVWMAAWEPHAELLNRPGAIVEAKQVVELVQLFDTMTRCGVALATPYAEKVNLLRRQVVTSRNLHARAMFVVPGLGRAS